MKTTSWILIGLLLASYSDFAVAQEASPAIPVQPINGILDAFNTHNVVALDEGNHGNEQGAAFRLSLIRDPRFARVINVIVVEFGNSLYQNVMDRFMEGKDVPEKELRQVWQNTTQVGTGWDKPIYEQFFRAVRDVNLGLPRGHRLRVLLGDPPVDWSQIKTEADRKKIHRLDSFPADRIQHEVLDAGHKALIVYGGLHYLRKNLYWPMQDRQRADREFNAPVDSIVTLLEANRANSVFSIYTNTDAILTNMQPDIASWQAPSLTILRGSKLGAAPFTNFFTGKTTIFNADGSTEQFGPDPVQSPTMQDEYDALLYLGPPSSITKSKISTKLCSDREYVNMRLQRFSLLGAQSERFVAAFRAECTN